MPRRTKDGPQRPPKPLPEELARISPQLPALLPGLATTLGPDPVSPLFADLYADKVRMTFRVVLGRQDAEALAARAIREEKNIGTLVTEILEAAGRSKRP